MRNSFYLDKLKIFRIYKSLHRKIFYRLQFITQILSLAGG